MKLSTRILIYAVSIIILLSIAIKIYYEYSFTPKINTYMEDSIKESMENDLRAFERIILTVVQAANGDGNVVKQALIAISRDKAIPISLKRSEFINRQFGRVPERSADSDIERKALKEGKPFFLKTAESFVYIYPLKAGKTCQTCHIDKSGNRVKIGYTLGLAIKTLPRSIIKEMPSEKPHQAVKKRLGRELSFVYYVVDLIWPGFLLLIFSMALLFLLVYVRVIRPINRLKLQVQQHMEESEQSTLKTDPAGDEIEFLRIGVEEMIEKDKH